MATDSGKKLFVGPRFRRIRQQLGLSQTQIAEGLGISPSYVNLIERNQRPVTAQILLRLAEAYDLDLRDLATADEDRFFAELNEIFSDPLFRQIDLPKQELRDLAELCPGVTHSLQRLYAAYTEACRGETLVAAQMADRDEGTRFEANPIERVRDLIEANRNYFPELEQAAENLRDELNVSAEELFAALSARLREKHSIVTRIMPVDVMRETLRRFDRHRRQLLISELIDGPGRAFQLALQIALAECSASIDAIVNRAGPLDDTPGRLLKQVIELPDGTRYFSIAQMVRRPVAPHPQPQPRFAIGLGCEIRHATKLVYAAGMDLDKAEGTPIGVNCRLCERENCSRRAEPPITRRLMLDENTRRVSSFAFSNAREL